MLSVSCATEISQSQGGAGVVKYKTISFESYATKTMVDSNGNVSWEKGDQISVYYVNADGKPAEAVATSVSSGETAFFTAEIPETDNPEYYFATYPSGKGELTLNDGAPSFTINVTGNSCDGSFKMANFAAAYTSAGEMSLAFRNAVGIIRLELPATGSVFNGDVEYPIDGVYLRCKATSVYLNGKLVFNPDAEDENLFSASTRENNMGGVANVNMRMLSQEVIKSGAVYIPCTEAHWEDGICIKLHSYAGHVPAVLSDDNPLNLKRSQIVRIADISSKIVWDYYVSNDASAEGKGLNEGDPMTLGRLQSEYLSPAKGFIAWALRLDGASINFKEGKYDLESTLEFPAASSGGEYVLKVNGNGAVLDGGAEYSAEEDQVATGVTGGCRVMSVGQYSHLTVRDLTLQNGHEQAGGGLLVNYTASSTDENSSVAFHNCRFVRNFTSANAGAAVIVSQNAAGGSVAFDQCIFKNNQVPETQPGAALYTSTGKATVMYNKCTFHRNFGYVNGTLIYLNNSEASLAMNNCTVTAAGTDDHTNGAIISGKGCTVIANSTIWAQESIGSWGGVALGAAVSGGRPDGSKIVASVIYNGQTKPGFYVHPNYYQHIDNCVYSGLTQNGAELGKTYKVDTESYDAGLGGTFANASQIDLLSSEAPYCAYSWDWTEGYPLPTLDHVREVIASTTKVGPPFLRWLDSIEGAFTTDIAGRRRNENAVCPGSYQQETTPDADDGLAGMAALRVMSFNVMREDLNSEHNWPKRRAGALQMLSVNYPDLMGLQECSWTIRQDILAADPTRRAVGVSVFGTESGYTKESSNSIIYRSDVLQVLKSGMFWLSDTPDKVSNTWNADKPRVCTWVKFRVIRTGHEFYHYNAHLHNGTTDLIKETRKKSMELILKRIAQENVENLPVIVTGDHNTTENVLSELYSPAGFISARQSLVTDDGRTFNSFGETATAVIDHIYMSAELTPSRFWVDRDPYAGITYISDHYPVFCDLTFKARKMSAVTDGFQFDEIEF